MDTEAKVRSITKAIESALVGQTIDMFSVGEQVVEDGSVHSSGVISFGEDAHIIQVSGARLDVKATPLAGATVTKVDYVTMPMDGYLGWSIKGYQGDGRATDMVFEIWNAGGEDVQYAVSMI